jgi:hypothetical protein
MGGTLPDLRALPLGDRKERMSKLLGGHRLGIVLSDHTDDDGAAIFLQACKMGLEGILSNRLSAPYRSGPSRDWLKVKNPDSPAMTSGRGKSNGEIRNNQTVIAFCLQQNPLGSDPMPTSRQFELDEAVRRALAEFGDGTATDYLIAVASDRTQADPREVIEAVEAVERFGVSS